MRTLSLISAFFLLLSVGVNSFGQGVEIERSDISKSITLYPNPTIEYVHVRLGILKANQVKLFLHNILGSEIAIESEIVDDHELRVRVKDIPTGYYLLAVRDEETQFKGTYKFLKR